MPRHHERRVVPFSELEMFALVADIERYPEFLPWCVGAKIVSAETVGLVRVQTADLTAAFAHLRETYTSRVELDETARTITAQHLKGPFQHLDTRWSFAPKGQGASVIDCTVDFAFKSRSLQAMFSLVFGKAVSRMTSAFEKRANALYGRRSKGPVRTDV